MPASDRRWSSRTAQNRDRRSLRRQQVDVRALGIDGLAVFRQLQVVEARTLEKDRAVDRPVWIAILAPPSFKACARDNRLGADGAAVGGATTSAGASAFLCWAAICCFCCRSICGLATKNCQPSSTSAESTMAANRLRLSFMEFLSRRHGVVALRSAEPGEGMAAQQPPESQQRTLERSVNGDGFDGVLRACRHETAGGRQHWRDEIAVETDRCDQHRPGNLPQPFTGCGHDFLRPPASHGPQPARRQGPSRAPQRPVKGGCPGNENIISTLVARKRQHRPRGFPQTPFGPVALDRTSDFPAGGKPTRKRPRLAAGSGVAQTSRVSPGALLRTPRWARRKSARIFRRSASSLPMAFRGLPFRQRASCGRGRAGATAPVARLWWTSASGTRGAVCARSCWVDRAASWSVSGRRKRRGF